MRTLPGKIKTYIFAVIHKTQLCQTLTDFNNFFSAETGKMYKTEHALSYLFRGRRPAARVSDLRVMRSCELDQSVMNHAIDE